jgi:hypothetical protein
LVETAPHLLYQQSKITQNRGITMNTKPEISSYDENGYGRIDTDEN